MEKAETALRQAQDTAFSANVHRIVTEKVLDGLLALARDPQVPERVRSAAYGSLKALVGMATD